MSDLGLDEQSFVYKDTSVDKLDCIIRAIYRLSFADYLRRNGLSEKDLDEKHNDMAFFRKPTAWPSQARFIFSLRQMRDAFAALGRRADAQNYMSRTQIEASRQQNMPKQSFWTILGDAATAKQSFRFLEQDESEEQLLRRRRLARAFRLTLFQQKVEQFRETRNFLALLQSVHREEAKQIFETCLDLVPFGAGFFDRDGDSDDDADDTEPTLHILIDVVSQLKNVQCRVEKLEKAIGTAVDAFNC